MDTHLEILRRFNDLDKRIDYWQRDMEHCIHALEGTNETLRELLEVIKGIK